MTAMHSEKANSMKYVNNDYLTDINDIFRNLQLK